VTVGIESTGYAVWFHALMQMSKRTGKELTERMRGYLAAIGSRGGKRGGKARQALLTPAERTALARKAARARWGGAK
jgi:hypothetical protein